jgi:hypothetical protein
VSRRGTASRVVCSEAHRFVATLLHPIFFTSGAKRCVEVDEDEGGNRRVHRSVKVEKYLKAEARKVTLMLPEPVECGAQVWHLNSLHPLHKLIVIRS